MPSVITFLFSHTFLFEHARDHTTLSLLQSLDRRGDLPLLQCVEESLGSSWRETRLPPIESWGSVLQALAAASAASSDAAAASSAAASRRGRKRRANQGAPP